ncbi:hypothetical protein CF319_g4556 [Tilletia indica]|nr:hypothetical protein CF319_g4556 [Tilletia indica]
MSASSLQRQRARGWIIIAALLLAPSSVHAFQYAVLSSTSCSTLAYSITLDSWEYKAATYLRTSLGDPDDPDRITQVELDQYFVRTQLESPFVTKWDRPLPKGGPYTLFFGLYDHKNRPIKLPGSNDDDNATATLPIPPCNGAAAPAPAQTTKTPSSSPSASSSSSSPKSQSSSSPPSTAVAPLSSIAVSSMTKSTSAASSPTSSSNAPRPSPSSNGSTDGANGQPSPSSKASGISAGAMAGAVAGAIAVTLFALWLMALCRRRVLRSVKNQNAHRASYLGPAPRPLLTPSGQSTRYYHTPTPGSSVMPGQQSKAAAFFAFFTGRRGRRRSVIQGIPPVMRQMTSNTLDASMYGGPEQPRRSMGTITPILRRPEDGFTPVGTAEQVAARRLSRESASRVHHHPTSQNYHGQGDSPYSSHSRPNSGSEQRYGGSSTSSFYGTSPGTGGGPLLVPLDASDPYGYDASAVTGNLVDTSDLPHDHGMLDQHLSAQQQQFPRPFLLGSQRPGSRSSSQSKNSVVLPQPSSNRPSFQSSTLNTSSGGGGTRPTSASSGTSYLQQQQQQGQPLSFLNPHKRNRPRNNDWATPYTPSLAGNGNNMSPGGRSRSSSTASMGGGGGGGMGASTGLGVKGGNLGLGFVAPPTYNPAYNQHQIHHQQHHQQPGSIFPSSSTNSTLNSLSSGAGSSMGVGASGSSSGISGLIPLQLAGSASSNLMMGTTTSSSAAFPKDPEPTAGGHLYNTRGRAGSASSVGGMSAGAGVGGSGTRGRTSMMGSIPLLAPMAFDGGMGSASGAGWYSGLNLSTGPGTGDGSSSGGSSTSMFASPLMTAIVPPIPAAAPATSPVMGSGAAGVGTSFLPGSGASSPAVTTTGLPARANSVSPGPSAKDTVSSTTSGGWGTNGTGPGPRKRPSFSFSNDPVAYMQATAGFARPPSRSNSVSGGGGGGDAGPVMDASNPLFAALSALDD